MEPIRTTELALQWAAPFPPAWLALALPAVVLAGLWLYRGPWRDVSRRQAAGLAALRAVLLAGLAFLAFRPSLLRRTILTYPGRVVLLLDDSGSMGASDSGLDEGTALRWARRLGMGAGAAPPCHEAASLLGEALIRLRRFQAFAREEDRSNDRFWREAEKAGGEIDALFESAAKAAAAVTGLEGGDKGRFDEALARLPSLRSGLRDFVSGEKEPPARVYDAYAERVEECRAVLFAVQAALDSRAGTATSARADEVRRLPRLALLSRVLESLGKAPAPAGEKPGNAQILSRLMGGGSRLLSDGPGAALEAVPGDTDILGVLERLVREENPFPLAGIVLFSDGRHLAGGSARATASLASQKQVPLYTAYMGASAEPHDLALLDVVAPPFAVKGAPVAIRIRLKTVLPEPADVRVEVLHEGKVVAEETVRAGQAPEIPLMLRFTPPASGRFRYTVRVEPLEAERLPARNNSRDVVIRVRDEKVRVLLLDGRPRWQTRFMLNILQRIDYIDLNAIIASTRPDGKVLRGVRKGVWPADAGTLALYDLVILGDLPDGLLTAAEWEALREAAGKHGRTVAFLGDGAGGARPPESASELWPFMMERGERSAEPDALAVTAAGRHHPVTAALATALPLSGEEKVPRLRPDTHVLVLAAPDGAPVIGVRRVGRGKTLAIDEDRLWKRLNPGHLAAHAELVVNLVSWAVEGDAAPEAAGGALPVLDSHAVDVRNPVQVWLPGPADGVEIEALVGGAVVRKRAAEATRSGAAWARAVFPALPADAIRFRVKGRAEATEPLLGVESFPELGYVARNDALLAALAGGSGGSGAEFTEAAGLLARIPPRARIEKQEQTWRLWDGKGVFAFLLLMLSAEWIWRKWAGLV